MAPRAIKNLAFLVTFLAALGYCAHRLDTNRQHRPLYPGVHGDPSKHHERRQFIDKLIAAGVFSKFDDNPERPRLWVTPAFYGVDFATKEQFVNVAWAYMGGDRRPTVRIILLDDRSGQRIGQYSAAAGGLQLE